MMFLQSDRQASLIAGEIPKESEQFRFIRANCQTNLKASVSLIMTKASAMRVTIPLDLSTKAYIPRMRGFPRARRIY